MFGDYQHNKAYRCAFCNLDWPPLFSCEECPKCGADTEGKDWKPMGKTAYDHQLHMIEQKRTRDEEARVAKYRALEADFNQFYTERELASVNFEAIDDEWASADWATMPEPPAEPAAEQPAPKPTVRPKYPPPGTIPPNFPFEG